MFMVKLEFTQVLRCQCANITIFWGQQYLKESSGYINLNVLQPKLTKKKAQRKDVLLVLNLCIICDLKTLPRAQLSSSFLSFLPGTLANISISSLNAVCISSSFSHGYQVSPGGQIMPPYHLVRFISLVLDAVAILIWNIDHDILRLKINTCCVSPPCGFAF